MIVKYSTAYGDVAFDLSRPHIVIELSGGFDSAVTLYGLAKAIHEHGTGNEIHPITVRKVSNKSSDINDDSPNPFPIVFKLVKWMQAEFPDVKIYEPLTGLVLNWWENEYEYKVAQKQKLLDQVNSKYGSNTTILYTGMTMNPPLVIGQHYYLNEDNILINFNPESKRNVKMPELFPNSVSSGSTYNGQKEFYPFRNFDKRAVFSFADTYYGDVDTFLNMTRSCEGSRNNTRNFTSICTGENDSDKCWWCYEREWATAQYQTDKQNEFKF